MQSENFSWVNVFKFAGAFVACAIGSGFATGQEILQFFTSNGLMSIGACIITTVLFSWFGAVIMEHGRRLKLKTSSVIIRYYFGQKLGIVFEFFIQLFLFAVFVIMISGAGATLAEYYKIDPLIGKVVMAALALFTVVLGLSKLTDILGMMGPIIILFSVGVGLLSIFGHTGNLGVVDQTMATLDVPRATNSWLYSGVLYPGYNIVAVVIFLAGIGSSARSKKEAMFGGTLGGIMFGLAILCMNLGLLSNITDIYDKQVPALTLASNLSPVIAVIFSVILMCGIYTTAVPMLWGVCNRFAEEKTKKFVMTAVILTIIALILGLVPFGELVGIVYPYTGYLGIILILVIFYRCYIKRENLEEIGKELNK